ncbi:pirin family protein [Thalassotalea sp. LPB0316]|uniref:pirin family protein n=1 Tax=Thalassotalea sp. LPB0316 TaxID=2769490 RepID=UPI001866A209|nr:pirin family protein [Thalassotalea sp. LPB0316]QOL26840.1 pirin family protein [Thalassotalea sp. LPB0316]
MITVRKSEDRGVANFGWLQSKHSFSFGHYYDPAHMGHSVLRVINDDVVAPSAGFDTHGHRNMEIISLVLEGDIIHQDSAGHRQVLPAGEFQLMSAGRGIFHSEFNHSRAKPLKFLQIWIEPNQHGTAPSYQQKSFGSELGLTTIITPDGANDTLQIKQNAKLHQLILASGSGLTFNTSIGRKLYVHLITGKLLINQVALSAGDGAKISDLQQLELLNGGSDTVTALVFELP